VIQVDDLLGEVRSINLRSSTIRTYDGAELVVPNSKLTANRIVNWTLSDARRRVDLSVAVAYGTDPARVIAILETIAGRHPDVLDEPAPAALLMGFGESALEFQLRAWIDRADLVPNVRSALGVAVCAAFAAEGIVIPFPQRDLHVRDAASDRLPGR
jgi:small-conductance mechanosensitive channel